MIDSMSETNRASTEYALIMLGTLGAISIFPFCIVRALNDEWWMAAADLFLSTTCLATAGYVYKTRKTRYAQLLMTTIIAVGVSLLINFRGAPMVVWFYPIMIGAYFISTPKTTFMLNSLIILSFIPKLYLTLPLLTFFTLILTLFMTNIFAFSFASRTDKQNKQLFNLVWFDSLTSIGNRRALDKKMNEIAEEAPRQMSLIIIDIDNFKEINDQYGHSTGDKILRSIANIISDRIRKTDALYRYGGEEFVVLAGDIDLENAAKLAEELRILVESHNLHDVGTVTISLGVAEFAEGEDIRSWFVRSDKALYRAKTLGRNKSCIAAPAQISSISQQN